MPLHIRVASVWKAPTVWVRNAGTWKKAAVWVKVAGVWKQITALISSTMVAVSGYDMRIQPADAVVVFQLSNAGTWTCTGGGSGTWRGGGASSDYDCRMTTVSGTLSSGDAVATWHNLGTTRNFTRNCTTNGYGSQTYNGTLEIRMAASPYTVLSSTSVSLLAETEV